MKMGIKLDLECAYCGTVNKDIFFRKGTTNTFKCTQCNEMNEVIKDFVVKKTLTFICNKCKKNKEHYERISIEGKNYCLECFREATLEFDNLINDDPDFKEQWKDGFYEWFIDVWTWK